MLDYLKICVNAADCGHAGLTIEEKTGAAMVAQAGEVLALPGGRLLMEAQALFSYGAAAASLRLLWRYRLLDPLMPPLAARFHRQRMPRCALQRRAQLCQRTLKG